MDTPPDPPPPSPVPRWAVPYAAPAGSPRDADIPPATDIRPATPGPATPEGPSGAPEQGATNAWAAPEPLPPIVAPRWGAWTPPPDERTITVGAVVGEAWATYRRAFGPLLVIGSVLGLLTVLLSLPTEIYTLRTYDAMFRVLFDALNTQANHNAIYDPILFRSQIEAIVRVPTGVAITFAVAGAAATVLGILGGCVLTVGALTARAGRRVSPANAVATVLGRISALVLPAVLIGLSTAAVSLAIQLNAQNIQDSDFSASAGSTSGTTLLGLAAILVGLAIFYLSVRWGLAIAAILAEGIGLRAGLRRSSQLTRGHRLRLAAIVIVVGLLQGLTVTLPAVVIGIVVGVSVSSPSTGISAFALAGVVGSALWAPVSSAVAAVAYGRLTESTREAAAAD